ncbi:hypothetical protein [Streptomyces sp. NBC_01174]|uniref:hypothetical protein n=1 Tax=Streptomyces sp. NBC_01174 TaxID=2903758 RepID=UPI0038657AC8|nr:hypothetical protein OG414_02510 [Streptomyces sp. NBC_01174]WSS80393.1 hypothetical protein OG414_36715 [Streptomyces sp. NBC_01174]
MARTRTPTSGADDPCTPTTAPSAPTPTAPGSLPLIGHAHRLARDPLPFVPSLREHGSVVRIRIGPTPAYVVTDPSLTRRVLVTDAAHFAKGGTILDACASSSATVWRPSRTVTPICATGA